MDEGKRGQVTGSAAEVYEEFFLPALFAAWSTRVADALEVGPDDAVLDVACGTGVLARELARRRGSTRGITGVDINPGMLAVARDRAPGIVWEEGPAEALPFKDGSFAAVGCQFALMFFEGRDAALHEMWRVLAPGGRLAVAVWDRVETSPGYAAMVELLDELFGQEAADALRAPFDLGDPAALLPLFERAGIPDVHVNTLDGEAKFPSLASWLHTDIRGWTLSDLIDDVGYARLEAAAPQALGRFVGEGGAVKFAAPAHIVTATKP